MEDKKKKGSWEPQSLQKAIDKVLSKEMSVRQAAMVYKVPKSTLQDKIKASNIIEDKFMEKPTQSISEPIATSPIPSTSSAPDLIQLIHKLSPLPDAAKKRTAVRKRKCERSEILTSSPYKKVVEEKENIVKNKKKEIGSKFKVAIEGNVKQTKGKSVEKEKQAKSVKSKTKNADKAKKVELQEQTSNTDKTICVVCLEDYIEDWILVLGGHMKHVQTFQSVEMATYAIIADSSEISSARGMAQTSVRY